MQIAPKIVHVLYVGSNQKIFIDYINDSNNLTSEMFNSKYYIFYNNCEVINKSHVISVLFLLNKILTDQIQQYLTVFI